MKLFQVGFKIRANVVKSLVLGLLVDFFRSPINSKDTSFAF